MENDKTGLTKVVLVNSDAVPCRNFIAETITAPGDSFVTSTFTASISSARIGSYPARMSDPDIRRQSESEAFTIITLFILKSLNHNIRVVCLGN